MSATRARARSCGESIAVDTLPRGTEEAVGVGRNDGHDEGLGEHPPQHRRLGTDWVVGGGGQDFAPLIDGESVARFDARGGDETVRVHVP